MSALTHALVHSTPREKAGAQTAAKYNFQWNYSLLKIIELHSTDADYRVLFEHFDDVIVLSPANDPTTAESYQVKGRATGRWTAASLAKADAKSKSPQSIVGKMFHNMNCLGANLTAARFVSNASYNFTKIDGKKTTSDDVLIACTSLSDDERKTIASGIEIDFPAPRQWDHEPHFFFEKTSLNIVDFDKHIKGLLVEFFDKLGQPAPITAVYDTLIAAISGRSSVSATASSLEDLLQSKSLARADVQSVFEAAAQRSETLLDHWAVAESDLLAGWTSLRIARFKTDCASYLRQRLRGDNAPVVFHSQVQAVAARLSAPISSCETLGDLLDLLRPELAEELTHLGGIDPTAALAVEAFEAWRATL